ncbi:MAG: diguanylate cyclase [Acidovorax sp.]|nr:diguanylate cyclase [Acidovorax sp.]
MALIVFSFALLGILSRPLNFTSALWPANPVLAGLMLRHPHLASSPLAWVGAGIGFVTADMFTGSQWLSTLWFTAANLVSSAVCCMILLHTDAATRRMQSQHSVLILFVAVLAAACASALVAGGTGPVLFQADLWVSLSMWFSGELQSNMLILPVLLALPRCRAFDLSVCIPARALRRLGVQAAPLAAVIASTAAALEVGGADSLPVVIPALLWCAISYRFLSTAILCLVVCLILTAEIAMGSFQFTPQFWSSALSLRVGITLLALGPLAMACNRQAHQRAMAQLDHTIRHDFLTGLLSRNAFFQQAQQHMEGLSARQAPVAMLVLDLDHFKHINDSLGHAAGDAVLRQFARITQACLGPNEPMGRLGGEEFLVLLPHVSQIQAQAAAQRLCHVVRTHRFALQSQQPLRVTVSIGLAYCHRSPAANAIDALIHSADLQLYQAKQSGRDRVVAGLHGEADAMPSHLEHRRHATSPR